MTEMKKAEKVQAVLVYWRDPIGNVTPFYEDRSKVAVVKVFELTESDETDNNDYRDANGSTWFSSKIVDAVFWPEDKSSILNLFNGEVLSDDIHNAIMTGPLVLARALEKEISVLRAGEQLTDIIHDYHLGNVSWEDIVPFIPPPIGISRSGVNRNRSEDIIHYERNKRIFSGLMTEIKEQWSALTGKKFDDEFFIGPAMCITGEGCSTGQAPHYSVSLHGFTATSIEQGEKYKLAKLVSGIIEAFFDHIGGKLKFVSCLYRKEDPMIFNYDGREITAKYAEHKSVDGDYTLKYVEISTDLLTLPIHVHF